MYGKLNQDRGSPRGQSAPVRIGLPRSRLLLLLPAYISLPFQMSLKCLPSRPV
jgi:hypothetical protein